MIPFHGWDMPLQYTTIAEEVAAVRENVGLFDISHMGQAEVKGNHALDLLQFLTCNDLSKITDGQAQYSALLNDEGGIVDDLVIYRVSRERFFLCLNAANTAAAVAAISEQALGYSDVEVRDLSRYYALIAVQGPNAEALLAQLTPAKLSRLHYYHYETTSVGGHNALLSRTGYTGEDGFEIFLDWREAAPVWEQIISRGRSFGLKLAGLGARDLLRLEMGYALHGIDIDSATTPYEAGLDWIVKLNKEDGFMGCETLAAQWREGVARKLVGFTVTGRGGLPRHGYPIFSGGEKVGEVTSGGISPTLKKTIGMGFVPPALAVEGTPLQIQIREEFLDAQVARRPFMPPRTHRTPKTPPVEAEQKESTEPSDHKEGVNHGISGESQVLEGA